MKPPPPAFLHGSRRDWAIFATKILVDSVRQQGQSQENSDPNQSVVVPEPLPVVDEKAFDKDSSPLPWYTIGSKLDSTFLSFSFTQSNK
jgi:hypothetical protein